MNNVRITKEFVFDMAHALHNYDGLCRNIHGHTYRLCVTLLGKPISDPNNVKLGMVMDFGELKRIVKEPLVEKFDHALVLNTSHNLAQRLEGIQDYNKIIELPFQPTCENLIIHFAQEILKRLPQEVSLHALRLYETPTSYAEWFASDN